MGIDFTAMIELRKNAVNRMPNWTMIAEMVTVIPARTIMLPIAQDAGFRDPCLVGAREGLVYLWRLAAALDLKVYKHPVHAGVALMAYVPQLLEPSDLRGYGVVHILRKSLDYAQFLPTVASYGFQSSPYPTPMLNEGYNLCYELGIIAMTCAYAHAYLAQHSQTPVEEIGADAWIYGCETMDSQFGNRLALPMWLELAWISSEEEEERLREEEEDERRRQEEEEEE